jgi:beta-lactam-binding protein with PASTA domain
MLLLLLLLILLALLCAGFAYMTWWRKDKPDAQPTPNPAVTATATGTSRPSPTVTTSPGTAPGTSPTASPPVSSPSPSPAKKTVAMPDVVGMPAADAKALLEGAGFTSIKFVAEGNPNADLSVLVSYTVTRQSVAAGTPVPVDTAIVITAKTTSNGKG